MEHTLSSESIEEFTERCCSGIIDALRRRNDEQVVGYFLEAKGRCAPGVAGSVVLRMDEAMWTEVLERETDIGARLVSFLTEEYAGVNPRKVLWMNSGVCLRISYKVSKCPLCTSSLPGSKHGPSLWCCALHGLLLGAPDAVIDSMFEVYGEGIVRVLLSNIGKVSGFLDALFADGKEPSDLYVPLDGDDGSLHNLAAIMPFSLSVCDSSLQCLGIMAATTQGRKRVRDLAVWEAVRTELLRVGQHVRCDFFLPTAGSIFRCFLKTACFLYGSLSRCRSARRAVCEDPCPLDMHVIELCRQISELQLPTHILEQSQCLQNQSARWKNSGRQKLVDKNMKEHLDTSASKADEMVHMLLVDTPGGKCSGLYSKARHMVNGYPVWKRATGTTLVLYTSKSGRWCITTDDQAHDDSNKNFWCTRQHGGRMPHELAWGKCVDGRFTECLAECQVSSEHGSRFERPSIAGTWRASQDTVRITTCSGRLVLESSMFKLTTNKCYLRDAGGGRFSMPFGATEGKSKQVFVVHYTHNSDRDVVLVEGIVACDGRVLFRHEAARVSSVEQDAQVDRLSTKEKKQDMLYQRRVRRPSGADAIEGTVVDIGIGVVGQRLYFVEYEGGDAECLEAIQVRDRLVDKLQFTHCMKGHSLSANHCKEANVRFIPYDCTVCGKNFQVGDQIWKCHTCSSRVGNTIDDSGGDDEDDGDDDDDENADENDDVRVCEICSGTKEPVQCDSAAVTQRHVPDPYHYYEEEGPEDGSDGLSTSPVDTTQSKELLAHIKTGAAECMQVLWMGARARLDPTTCMAEIRRQERAAGNRCCVNCGLAEGSSAFRFQKCSGCSLVFYCGRDCQKVHWKTHKSDCRRAKRNDGA